MSLPTISRLPDLIGSKPIAAFPTVVFPEPDSPTKPTISPGKISSEKFFTAVNAGIRPLLGYSIVTSRILRTGWASRETLSSRFLDEPSFGTAASNCLV